MRYIIPCILENLKEKRGFVGADLANPVNEATLLAALKDNEIPLRRKWERKLATQG